MRDIIGSNNLTDFERGLNRWVDDSKRMEMEKREEAKDRILQAWRENSTSLRLDNLNLKSIPDEIFSLTQLTDLHLENNYFGAPSDINNISNLSNLKVLNLSNIRFGFFPSKIFDLHNLEELYCSNINISQLPYGISNLSKLKVLDLSHNILTEFSHGVDQLRQLEELRLNNNYIGFHGHELPPIGSLTELRVLHLDNNELKSLPPSMDKLIDLEKISLLGNGLPNGGNYISNNKELMDYLDTPLVRERKAKKLLEMVQTVALATDTGRRIPDELLAYALSYALPAEVDAGKFSESIKKYREIYTDLQEAAETLLDRINISQMVDKPYSEEVIKQIETNREKLTERQKSILSDEDFIPWFGDYLSKEIQKRDGNRLLTQVPDGGWGESKEQSPEHSEKNPNQSVQPRQLSQPSNERDDKFTPTR